LRIPEPRGLERRSHHESRSTENRSRAGSFAIRKNGDQPAAMPTSDQLGSGMSWIELARNKVMKGALRREDDPQPPETFVILDQLGNVPRVSASIQLRA